MKSVDDTVPPGAEGLERHLGFKEFETLVKRNDLKPGSTIAIFSPFTNPPPRSDTVYTRLEYTVVGPDVLRQLPSNWDTKPRKLLKGEPWYVVQRV